jgi:chemotaxis response regulator CheB
MSDRDIVVIGGSAGGAPAVAEILRSMPVGFPAAIFVVLHRTGVERFPLYVRAEAPQNETDPLVNLLARQSALPVQRAVDLEEFQPAKVYVAPSNQHLYLETGITRLEKGPKENFFRPSIDVLFRSAAAVYGRRTIGVLVSGMLRDGTAGLWQIKKHGGICIVQNPQEAQYPGMPQSALDSDAVHLVLPIEDISLKLIDLTTVDPHKSHATTKVLIVEDERIVAKHLQDSLSDMGYLVTGCVSSGQSAIKLARENKPELVLMDIHLKGQITGIDATRRIWEELQIPVVYLTAHADSQTLEQVQKTHYYGYIVKPVHAKAVRAAIELALGRRKSELR